MHIQKSFENSQSGILYLIPTPIGNLEDMTYRAVRLLDEVTLIAAEDTRQTKKLLNHFHIKTPQISLHEHNIMEKIDYLIDKLHQGESIAQVSDAGMPSISDPGHELVLACLEQHIPVVSIPGASAGLTALIASGLSPQPFYFYGFLPRKKQEQIFVLEQLKSREETLIFYESPHRIKKTIQVLSNVFDETRQAVICRELTKRYEEYIRGSLKEIQIYLEEIELKGEICLLVSGTSDEDSQEEMVDLPLKECVLQVMQEQDLTAKEAIKYVAKMKKMKKQDVYQAYHQE
ncbi:16S rRNA (cytidine(1402)-2'-O)-methyltransferase [Carnobacteriaceae bacterium zg-84]|uniref:16S rRNA (cytidine(1402)-2'-O)-methyltransferase n=1 Tax=Granulicatella sp. zg-84 TaxID=2678503 RepID=UPI0013C1CC73|nr:16S rRNA (cytidine(1402)-2'-O)-methyltransferase [Granulicatella sp. zg-84]NEW65685.1 16S rRNA (cytidine(1402)-2'-O)-methyltransferase [Granulicatella sp. zg-84]QMI85675.1 16S rRNA (cytidine(1402)-2'-O)-methyltransferase [Carnobacteriaceae bacterium zg-84]